MRLLDNALLCVAAKLNIADELAGGPQTPAELADGGKREAEMPRAETRVDHSSRLPGFVLKATDVALKTWQSTVSRRRAIADFPPERLRDIGQAEAPAAVLEVKPGLVTNLMSMR